MNVSFKFLSTILLFVAMTGCSTNHAKGPTVIPINYSLHLSDEQVGQLTSEGQHGDGAAAFKLYEYYSMVKLDRDAALQWLTKAAEYGHNAAEYNLGMVYTGEIYPDKKDLEKARYWFQKSADSGDPEAKRKLRELEK